MSKFDAYKAPLSPVSDGVKFLFDSFKRKPKGWKLVGEVGYVRRGMRAEDPGARVTLAVAERPCATRGCTNVVRAAVAATTLEKSPARVSAFHIVSCPACREDRSESASALLRKALRLVERLERAAKEAGVDEADGPIVAKYRAGILAALAFGPLDVSGIASAAGLPDYWATGPENDAFDAALAALDASGALEYLDGGGRRLTRQASPVVQ